MATQKLFFALKKNTHRTFPIKVPMPFPIKLRRKSSRCHSLFHIMCSIITHAEKFRIAYETMPIPVLKISKALFTNDLIL